MVKQLVLEVMPQTLAVCRLAPDDPVPEWARGEFVSITRTSDELSIVCSEARVPADVRRERSWRAIRIKGPLDFALTGVLESVAEPLAEAGIPVFVVSTFATDYVLVKQHQLAPAIAALQTAGHILVSTSQDF